MSAAVIRCDGEFFRVYHNGWRSRGQYSRQEAEGLRDMINSGTPTGCDCADCVKERAAALAAHRLQIEREGSAS